MNVIQVFMEITVTLPVLITVLMVPVTEMDPVFVRKALLDSVVVLKTVKEAVMTKHLYVHHVRKDIMETSVLRDVQITVRMAVLRMKENVINVLKDTGETSVIKVRNIFIPIEIYTVEYHILK